MHEFSNNEYQEPLLTEEMADESVTFARALSGLINDHLVSQTDEKIWLGTLNLKGQRAQVQLVITQQPDNFIDEE